jgi:hypothetical protein
MLRAARNEPKSVDPAHLDEVERELRKAEAAAKKPASP